MARFVLVLTLPVACVIAAAGLLVAILTRSGLVARRSPAAWHEPEDGLQPGDPYTHALVFRRPGF